MRHVEDWPTYFMDKARKTAERSKDDHLTVGAILVDPTDNHELVSGYNGFIAGTKETKVMWNRPHKYIHVVHAEANAIARAAKKGIPVDGATLYCTLSPCLSCMKLLLSAGIKRIEAYRKYPGPTVDGVVDNTNHKHAMLEAKRAKVPVNIWT